MALFLSRRGEKKVSASPLEDSSIGENPPPSGRERKDGLLVLQKKVLRRQGVPLPPQNVSSHPPRGRGLFFPLVDLSLLIIPLFSLFLMNKKTPPLLSSEGEDLQSFPPPPPKNVKSLVISNVPFPPSLGAKVRVSLSPAEKICLTSFFL